MKNNILYVFIIAIFLLSSYCKENIEKISKMNETNNEIQNVMNKNIISENNLLKTELEISLGENTKDFYTIDDLDIDEKDNIYILDRKDCNVKIFNKNGKLKKKLGKKGNGPGEFKYPINIDVNYKNKVIIINDFLSRELVIFSLNGEFIKNINYYNIGQINNFKYTDDGNFVCSIVKKETDYIYSIEVYDSELKKIQTIDSYIKMKLPVLELLSNKYIYVIEGKNVIWGQSEVYKINIHEIGRNEKIIIKKEHKDVKINKELFSERIIRKFGTSTTPPQFENDLPKYYPVFEGIIYDNVNGKIWVEIFKSNSRNINNIYDVYNKKGEFFKKIVIPFKVKKIMNEKIYSIEENDNNINCLKRYKFVYN